MATTSQNTKNKRNIHYNYYGVPVNFLHPNPVIITRLVWYICKKISMQITMPLTSVTIFKISLKHHKTHCEYLSKIYQPGVTLLSAPWRSGPVAKIEKRHAFAIYMYKLPSKQEKNWLHIIFIGSPVMNSLDVAYHIHYPVTSISKLDYNINNP